MRLVYVAGPYRGPSAWKIEENIRRAECLALEVWKGGMACICPHTNTRFYQGEAADEIWLQGDLEIMSRCDWVLMVPGWESSTGATAERDYAIRIGIPVVYSLEELWRRNWGGRQDQSTKLGGVSVPGEILLSDPLAGP